MSALLAPAARAREFAFGPEHHAAIARFAYEEAGILLPTGKAQLVYGRLARRLRARGIDDFGTYIALLDEDREERVAAIDALTTNHTSFFREGHHFEHFMAECWPALERRLAGGGRARIWSAACSSGEEPYTLVLSILGKDRNAAQTLGRRDLRILATDLSSEILAAARAARYAADTVKTVPAELRSTWFRQAGPEFELKPEARALVHLRSLNLLGEWPMRQQFDAIFCRNVMIYFDEATKARLQSRLADRLVRGGFLYIGHSERLAPEVGARFECLGRTIFRKVAA